MNLYAVLAVQVRYKHLYSTSSVQVSTVPVLRACEPVVYTVHVHVQYVPVLYVRGGLILSQ